MDKAADKLPRATYPEDKEWNKAPEAALRLDPPSGQGVDKATDKAKEIQNSDAFSIGNAMQCRPFSSEPEPPLK